MEQYDLGATDIICEPFSRCSSGRLMPPAHMFANGRNGFLRKMTVIDPVCEVISEEYTVEKNLISPSMTRFVNSLGGHVVVMGMTLKGNRSQALFNHRRQRLFQTLLIWCADEYAFVENEPDVYVIMNRALDPARCGFRGLVTLLNLCDDPLSSVSLHLPEDWRDDARFLRLDKNGEWTPLDCKTVETGVEVSETLSYCDPLIIKII